MKLKCFFFLLYLVDRFRLNHVITVVTESLQNRLRVTENSDLIHSNVSPQGTQGQQGQL